MKRVRVFCRIVCCFICCFRDGPFLRRIMKAPAWPPKSADEAEAWANWIMAPLDGDRSA